MPFPDPVDWLPKTASSLRKTQRSDAAERVLMYPTRNRVTFHDKEAQSAGKPLDLTIGRVMHRKVRIKQHLAKTDEIQYLRQRL